MSIKLDFDFSSSTDFTFDSDLIEFVGGKALLKDLRPTSSTFYASYTSSIDGNWGDGILTGNSYGGASVSGGKLDLSFNDLRYVNYDATDNANSAQKGAIRFDYIPNYTGAPATYQVFFYLWKSPGTFNLISIYHTNAGKIEVNIYDALNVSILSMSSAWSPTLGQSYEFELNYNLDDGRTELFIDGISFLVSLATGTRDDTSNTLRVGSDNGGSYSANFKIDNFIVFSSVQHVSTYVPNQPISETIYSTADPDLKPSMIVYIDGLDGFVEVVSGIGAVKYILMKDNVRYYHNGANWIVSDGTYAQSNTASEIETNKAGFTVDRIKLDIEILLHSTGNDKTHIDNLEVSYDFAHPVVPTVDECLVYGFFRDIEGNYADNDFKVKLNKSSVEYKDSVTIKGDELTIEIDEYGYFEISLVDTTQMEDNTYYIFILNNMYFRRLVPNEASKNFWELTDVI